MRYLLLLLMLGGCFKGQALTPEEAIAKEIKLEGREVKIVSSSTTGEETNYVVYVDSVEYRVSCIYSCKVYYRGGAGQSSSATPTPTYRPSSNGPNCTKGCRCGNSCIDCSKKCTK